MFLYVIAFIFLILILLGYFRLANHFNIIDKPNERSSHTYVTIRGGGIVFPVAALLWFLLFGFNQPWLIFALLLMAAVSLLDDAITLTSKIRILIHFGAVSLLFWQLHVFEFSWVGILVAYLFTIGWINAFNFMDGINGITGFYGLVALGTFAWLNRTVEFVSQQLVVLLILSVLIFLFFNARKRAKTFAGDVGSVSMAFLLAWFMISLMIHTGRLEYILFFLVYGIDSVVTILFRLMRSENIFEAHRSHLYQFLGNELRWPHVLVAIIYSVLQAGVNIFSIWLIAEERMTWPVFVIFMIMAVVGYLLLRIRITREITSRSVFNMK